MSKNFHEQFDRPELPLPADRSTGLVFTAVALIIAWLWRGDEAVLIGALTVAGVLGLTSLLAPGVLRPLNIAWMRFGMLLGRVVNPVVMAVLYAVVIVPAGLIMQLRYDPLRRKRCPEKSSYWIERARPIQHDMTKQF